MPHMTSWFLMMLSVRARVTHSSPLRVCDVTDFGAKGDNRTKDTDAVKQAIASCAGGGVILFPATEPRVYM